MGMGGWVSGGKRKICSLLGRFNAQGVINYSSTWDLPNFSQFQLAFFAGYPGRARGCQLASLHPDHPWRTWQVGGWSQGAMDPWTHGPMPCHSRARPSGAHGGPNYYESGGATFFCWGWEGAGSSMSGKVEGRFHF